MAASLTPKQELFVAEYLRDFNATRAAIRAGYSEASAGSLGSRLLTNAEVAAAVEVAKNKLVGEVMFEAADVRREIWNQATADAGELVQYRRLCCRYCHGVGHEYQQTPRELRQRYVDWQAAVRRHESDRDEHDPGPFSELGGLGYDKRRDPHPDCPECFGEGIGETFVNDTRKLSAKARTLYAGAKETKDGVEIKLNSRDKMVELAGKSVALFTDNMNVNDTSEKSDAELEAEVIAGYKAAIGDVGDLV